MTEIGTKYYKLLKNGRSFHGGSLEWDMPTDGKPGSWHEVTGKIVVCAHGLHLTSNPAIWFEAGVDVFEAEYEGTAVGDREKLVVSRARLVCKLSESDLVPLGILLSGDHNIHDHARVHASGNARVYASENATVIASGNATVYASTDASVIAYDNAMVSAYGDAMVSAYDNATVTAFDKVSVTASDNARVFANDNATVTASSRVMVTANDNATVMAYGDARVTASCTVIAYGNARVEASGTVMAYGDARVEASENATVTASDNTTVEARSGTPKITLEGNAVYIDRRKGQPVVSIAKKPQAKKRKNAKKVL